MNSKEYWAKREAEQLKHNITEEAEYDKEIQRIYSNMLDACNKEINAFYGKYADKEGITLAEAKKRVSSLDIKEYERKAQRYVKDAALDRKANGGKTNKSGYYFSAKAEEEMRLYNATMKINRLEMLKANIGIELIKGHDELDKFMGDILKWRTMAELERQAGILGKTVRNNAKTAHAIVNGSFHSGTFSDRIWQYQDIMREDLGKLLQTALIRGKNPRAIAGDLKKYWYGNDPKTGGGAKYCMERLMRTELARVQTEAQKQSFERNGFDKYIFIVNAGCCGHCEEVADKDIGHGKGVYLVKDMQPGLNAPPIHPHDRCSTAAYSDRKEYEEWLDYLEKGGTTEEYNKMKAVKNDADRQAQIRARREAYKQRKSTQSTPDFDSMDKSQLEMYATKSLKTPFENTKGVATDFMRETVKVVHRFEQKLGGKIEGLKISFGNTGQGRYASYDFKTKTLHLKKTGSLEAFAEKQRKENIRSQHKLKKDYHATPTYSGTVWHELGHAIDDDTGQKLSKALSATKELDTKSVKISVYAGSSPALNAPKRSEAWAENFAAYMEGGTKASEVPLEIVEMIEDYFKKKKGS